MPTSKPSVFARQMRQFVFLLLLGLLLAACVPAAERGLPDASVSSSPAAGSPEPSFGISSLATDPMYFKVDQVVRSSAIEGIDLHVRYVERTDDRFVVHVSFYNNRGETLDYVQGIDPDAARLAGAVRYSVAEHSSSLDGGIAPTGDWLSGGGNVGWLAFRGVRGERFTFECPGFPPVQLGLDQPLTAAPDPPPPPPGDYDYDIEVLSPQIENIALRVERAQVDDQALRLSIAFVNRNPTDVTFSSSAALSGMDGALFDELWQQYLPTEVDPALAESIAPAEPVWRRGEANAGTLTFPLPKWGDALIYQFPGFPPVWLPLSAGEQARVATAADLPPSDGPKPEIVVAPTPRVPDEEAQARQAADRLLQSLSRALRRGDREAYLQGWSEELHPAQSDLFEQAQALPLEAITFTPDYGEQNGVLVEGGATLSDYRVALSYRIQDVDPQSVFSTPLRLTLRRRDDDWVITQVDGHMPFWGYAPTRALRSGAFWIFYRPEMADEVPMIEKEAHQALDVVEQSLPDLVDPPYVLHVTATDDEFADLTGRSSQGFLGVALARYTITRGGIEITNRSMFVHGAAFMRDPAQDRQQTIAHELTHLVLAPATMPYTPAWISEGAAMYVTKDFSRAVLERWYEDPGPESIDLAALSSQTSFGLHDFVEHQISVEYAYSAYLTRYLVERYGEEQFLELYEAFAEVPIAEIEQELAAAEAKGALQGALSRLAGQFAAEHVQAIYGIDLAVLERDFEAWLAQQLE